MTELQIFENETFGKVRIMEIDGEPWFVGKDVAEALGYSNASKAVSTHVDSEDKQFIVANIADSQNGNLQSRTAIINESGLYALILSSKLPQAKQFKRWITHEVIPSIRKHQAYMTPATIEKVLYNPDFLIQLATNLKSEQEKNRELSAQNKELKSENQEVKTVNEALVGEIQQWDYKALIIKLIRVYSARVTNGIFGVGWNHYYDELLYKYGINLRTRKTKNKTSSSCLDFISQNEIGIAVKVAVAMCEKSDIKTDEFLNKYKLEKQVVCY